jgi:hypothetical protein
MHPMQLPGTHSLPHSRIAEASCTKLFQRNEPVLPLGSRCNVMVDPLISGPMGRIRAHTSRNRPIGGLFGLIRSHRGQARLR